MRGQFGRSPEREGGYHKHIPIASETTVLLHYPWSEHSDYKRINITTLSLHFIPTRSINKIDL